MTGRLAHWRTMIRRVHEAYRDYHGRELHLLRPRRYTEKMQWRKLFDLDQRYAILSDKLAARDIIAARVGREHLIPLLWQGDDPDDIPFDTLTPPFVLKSSHASGHTIIVGKDEPVDRDAIRATARAWLGYCHGTRMDEPAYVHVPHRLMIERQLLRTDGTPPIERKMLVFHGKVAIIRTTVVDNARNRRVTTHTSDWEQLGWIIAVQPLYEAPLPRPVLLEAMMRAASAVGAGFDHLRIDMYDDGERFWLGEITVYSWSGLEPIVPDEADYRLGALWRLRHPLLRAAATILTRVREIRPPACPPCAPCPSSRRAGRRDPG